MRIYLDTSAAVSLFLEEPRGAAVAAMISQSSNVVLSSALLIGEFGAAVSTAVRMERLRVIDANRVCALFDGWIDGSSSRIAIDEDILRIAIGWVRRPELGLLFPDALHLAICQGAQAKLITGDKRQADAGMILGVEIERID